MGSPAWHPVTDAGYHSPMPIRWDALLTRHAALALDRELGGASLRALRFDGSERDLLMLFDDRTLVWRLHPSRGVFLTRPPTPPAPSDITHRARIRQVVAPVDERILRFELLPKRGGPHHDLVVELMGNQWNAVVVDASSGIVRHVLWSRNTSRGHRVGERYAPPPDQGRAGPDGSFPESAWSALLSPLSPERRKSVLVKEIAWTSPINASYLLGEDEGPNESDEARLALGHRRWRSLAGENVLGPSVVLDTPSGPQPYPLPLPGIPSNETEGLLAAFEEAFRRSGSGEAATEAPLLEPHLMRRLEDEAKRADRRLRVLERELEELDDEHALRAVGDLILARYGEVASGTETIVLEGFDGEAVTIALDPAKQPHENATDYYDRATRVERARTRLPDMIEQARAERARLDDLLARARAGSAEPEEVRARLPTVTTDRRGRTDETPLPYKAFRSSGDLEIRVGKGARHNDELTFRHAAPGDVWLHARHAAGAHVILRWQGPGNPPARDLMEAATLAALYSKARTSGSVPVDWTFRKYVRKPRGAPKGAVVPDRVSTLFVRPDPDLEKTLARERDG